MSFKEAKGGGMSMKGREMKGANPPPSADLLVCFPSRAHLTLMPKSICSPARGSTTEPNNNNNSINININRRPHHRRRPSAGRRLHGGGVAHASPVLWGKTKQQMGSSDTSEPTSPKVTCAGQIKVRHKTGNCKSWQSVMEEIERIHKQGKQRKKKQSILAGSWAESLGLKKDAMQFLACLRNIRFDFRCFGSFPQSEEEEEEEAEEEGEEGEGEEDEDEAGTSTAKDSTTVFSKWFMVLQEEKEINKDNNTNFDDEKDADFAVPEVPPPNALLLMRCRSAPAKSWLQQKQQQEEEEEEEEEEAGEVRNQMEGGGREDEKGEEKKRGKNLKTLMEEEKKTETDDGDDIDRLVVMRYDTDFYKISCDVAKETWVVGGIRDTFSRSRSWKR